MCIRDSYKAMLSNLILRGLTKAEIGETAAGESSDTVELDAKEPEREDLCDVA